MHADINVRRALLFLVAGALILPVAVCVTLGVGLLLGAVGDSAGGAVLSRIALSGGIVWVIDLICLVVVQALSMLFRSDNSE